MEKVSSSPLIKPNLLRSIVFMNHSNHNDSASFPTNQMKEKILIVDDLPDNVRLLSNTLSDKGYEIRCAISGSIAMMGIAADKPDLILLDITMPDMDGFEICRALKEKPETADIPIIFISALGEVLDKVKAFEVGGADYITKPFQLGEVLARVHHQLEISRLRTRISSQNHKLQETLQQLRETQDELLQSEKMAALGSLVAGISHEVNTPMGAALLGASTLEKETQKVSESLAQNDLRRSTLERYFKMATDCGQLVVANLQRAEELIQSFKNISVDQTNLRVRNFAIKPYIQDILTSLKPTLKRAPHQIQLIGSNDLMISSYPGAVSQIITNLLLNSLTHAYSDGELGKITITLSQPSTNTSTLEYRDDGNGIPPANLNRIFELFFTTAHHPNQGDGLGLYLVHDLVTQKLQGSIEVNSTLGEGTQFTIKMPSFVPANEKLGINLGLTE